MLLTYLQSRVVYRNGHKMPHYNNATLIRVRGGGASGGGAAGASGAEEVRRRW
jgi:hypothetical protein